MENEGDEKEELRDQKKSRDHLAEKFDENKEEKSFPTLIECRGVSCGYWVSGHTPGLPSTSCLSSLDFPAERS